MAKTAKKKKKAGKAKKSVRRSVAKKPAVGSIKPIRKALADWITRARKAGRSDVEFVEALKKMEEAAKALPLCSAGDGRENEVPVKPKKP